MRVVLLWRRIPSALFAVLSATVLTLASLVVQRVGPEQESYGNLCGPRSDDACLAPRLAGGWPFAFLFDVGGVSVEHQLGAEDRVRVWAFAVDDALYAVGIVWVMRGLRRRVRGHGNMR